jgi:hypothetical protein
MIVAQQFPAGISANGSISPGNGRLKNAEHGAYRSVVCFTDYVFTAIDPSSELLGYCHSSAVAD